MIFGRNRKRDQQETAEDVDETSEVSTEVEDEASADAEPVDDAPAEDSAADVDGATALDVEALDATEWRLDGPFDVHELHARDDDDDTEETDGQPRIDLGSLLLTGLPGSELRLQVAEETQEIVSAMLIFETPAAPANGSAASAASSSALELSAFAAPRSGGLWAELRDEIAESATAAGGTASLAEGPFGVELRRLIPVTTPDGEQGYQPSRMWVAEGPRWMLRGIVYGQAAIEEDLDSPSVATVVAAFRAVVVRRGDEAMAPGDLLPMSMPTDLAPAD